MKRYRSIVASSLLAVAFTQVASLAEDEGRKNRSAKGESINYKAVEKSLEDWPARPRLAVLQMIDKYGLPQEATPMKVVWHNNGPWKQTVVTRKELPHHFPHVHMDYIEQTIDYRVPADKADELIAFDGSVTIDRTAGEVSSRCDREGANFLTLNLVDEIVTGKKDVQAARKAFGQTVAEFMLGKDPAMMKAFQFQVQQAAADPDEVTMPGAPVKPTGDQAFAIVGKGGMSDAHILGSLVAINENEISGASHAVTEEVSPEVKGFAQMLHQEHGKNLDMTMKLAEKIGVTPVETEQVDKMRVEAAGHLAELVPLEGERFAQAYVGQAVKEHQKVLSMIDDKLLKSAQNEELKKHLQATREHVAMHLEEAKKLLESVD